MVETSTRPWIVARTRPQQMDRAVINVNNQGAECYVPKALFRSARSAALRTAPLFPGYIFVRHPAGLWVFLKGTFGVLDVLMRTEEFPAYLSDVEVVKLREREGPDGLVRLEAREFEPGEPVRIARGAVHLDGVVDGMASRDRIWVLMHILGEQTRVDVAVKDVTRG